LGRGGTGALSGAFIAARGLEALEAEMGPGLSEAAALAPPEPDEIRISSNENPLGPGKLVMEALIKDFEWVGRYPMNSQPTDKDLMKTLAKVHEAKPENIVLGAGSGEILRNAVRAFTSPERHLVTAAPSFENPVRTAKLIGTPVKALPLNDALRLDLDAMAGATKRAGLAFVCNPNNPTATVHSADAIHDYVKWVRRASPDTAILIDEAYHDYVTDPSYQTSLALAMEHPNVFVTRTFSKAHGMAGLRVGYGVGREETIKALARYRLPFNVNVLSVAAAITSIGDIERIAKERARNTAVRKFTREFFSEAGFEPIDSQTNFIFVDIGRSAKDFREACEKHNVKVGRDFPPYEKTHVRISIGTMEEMRRAMEVFAEVLGVSSNDSPNQK
jgi:histidinol-phosphate aminotransferase